MCQEEPHHVQVYDLVYHQIDSSQAEKDTSIVVEPLESIMKNEVLILYEESDETSTIGKDEKGEGGSGEPGSG